MSKKSKAIIVENKVVSSDYNGAVGQIADALNTMFNETTNQISELYRISQFVRVFAQQKAYLDKLREEFSQAKQNKDLYKLKSVSFKVNNNLESKTFDNVWSDIAQMYDSMICSVAQEETSEKSLFTFKTSDDIYNECYKYYIESKEDKLADEIKTIEYMLNI